MQDFPTLALEEAVLKSLADSVGERLKATRERMQAALETSGATKLNASLPNGTKVGTVSQSTPKPKAVVTDPDALLAWVRETSPSEVASRVVVEVRPAYLAALLAEMTAAGAATVVDSTTGEVREVPGVEVRASRSASHSVQLVDGGREAIAAAWRAGHLAHLDLPQLGPAGSDAEAA